LLALKLGKHNGNLGNAEFMSLIAELNAIPKKIEEVLEATHELTQSIAKDFINATNFLYLGRGYNYPAALEGALKLKEISYIHAEGYPAAEMKHGPIALIDENMPIVIIAPKKGHYDKIVSNVQEIKARKGKVIAVVNKGDTQVSAMADYVIEIPETSECFSPIVASVPLQLLAYYIAVYRGANVDQPRNLAKSVTVE
jgi:glucosamine--fructose-6-phosphate aminotransferase (isomerizing)